MFIVSSVDESQCLKFDCEYPFAQLRSIVPEANETPEAPAITTVNGLHISHFNSNSLSCKKIIQNGYRLFSEKFVYTRL